MTLRHELSAPEGSVDAPKTFSVVLSYLSYPVYLDQLLIPSDSDAIRLFRGGSMCVFFFLHSFLYKVMMRSFFAKTLSSLNEQESAGRKIAGIFQLI